MKIRRFIKSKTFFDLIAAKFPLISKFLALKHEVKDGFSKTEEDHLF